MLIKNWRQVARYAWSVRLAVLASILSAFEVALPFMDGYLPIPQGVFAILAGLSSGGAFIARFVAQRQLSGDDR